MVPPVAASAAAAGPSSTESRENIAIEKAASRVPMPAMIRGWIRVIALPATVAVTTIPSANGKKAMPVRSGE
ncbi:hypothetical protein C7C45_31880 [Micromonospora arborensis]|uniref:Uncharacterized protein n=1 Tax=Micromonospora arborensis TaxID=2116518 RepID=A0A318NBR9_9ACTN|nr:hypothetical protein C7C45_31880 [Micromonospora arborensis]